MNPTQPSRIAKNTTYLTIAFIIQKTFSFLYYTYIARQIGDESLGKYGWALALTGIFALFIEFGLGPVLTREVARTKDKAKEYLGNVIGIKIIFAVVVLLVLYATIGIMDKPQVTKVMVYLASILIILDSFTFTFYSLFRAFQILRYEAIGIVIYQALIVISGVIVIALKLPLPFLIGAIMVGSLFNFIYSFTLVIKKAQIKPRLRFNKKVLSFLLKIAIPFALAGIFVKASTQIDVVLLGNLAGDRFTGWYLIPSKITNALTVLPGAFATSFFPAMSYYFIVSRERLARIFERAMGYLLIISLPISAGVIVLADKIVLGMYGSVFEASIQPLKIFMISLVFIFLNFPVGNLLNACNKQTINTINMGIALVVNIILNIILIPKYTFMGASIAALATAVLLLGLGLPWVSTIIYYSKKYILVRFLKTLFSGSVMAGFILFFRSQINILVLIFIGALVYLGVLYILRGITKDDILSLYASVVKKSI